MIPTLVVVSGPGGTGKTTLAHLLASAIECPALCRDEIKEGMVHASRAQFVPAPGDPLTDRTLSVFFAALRLLVDNGVTVVAEAAFQDRIWQANLEPFTHVARLRIVRCTADPDVARRRLLDRPPRRAHADAEVIEDIDYYANFVPISLAAPTIDVDTTAGYQPTLEAIAAFAGAA